MKQINNAFYEELAEKWYTEWMHPIALLRKENEKRNPWIRAIIHEVLGLGREVLDVGCGGGFLMHALANAGHSVIGVDLSLNSLQMAQMMDETKEAHFIHADAHCLPFSDGQFDVVCAMDLLEHVSDPLQVIAEAARVLKRGGLFFFHTFNRNWLSWLIVIKGVEWCVPNTPADMHVYDLFIKPKELKKWCLQEKIEIREIQGLVPKLSWPFWKSLFKREVDAQFSFRFCPFLTTGYMGYGIKH